jgi:very-short-patch-repair endonuclease
MAWVRKVLDDVEPLLESALEGFGWAEITSTGLPRPQPQQWVTGRSGRRYRVDFLFDGRVVLEADGSGKYSEQTPWEEKQRQSDLEAAGYWVVRCTWEEILRRPHEVMGRIRRALARSLPR